MGNQKKRKKENSFLVQGSVLAVAGIISRLIGIIYRVPLQNIMTISGQGFYENAFQIYQIALLLTSYSLPLAVSKLVSERMAKGERRNAYRVFKSAMTFAIVVGSGIAIIVFIGADFIAANIMKVSLSAYALRVLAPGLLLVAIMGVLRGYFQGLGTMLPTAVTQILEQVINAIVSLIGAVLLMSAGKEAAEREGNELLGAAYSAAGGTLGTVAGALCGLLFLMLLFYAYRHRLKRQLRSDRSADIESYGFILKIMLLTIAPVILGTVVYNLQNVMDNAMFNRVMAAQGYMEADYVQSNGKLGQYYILFSVPLAIANALASSFIPSIVGAVESKRKKVIYQKIYSVVRATMLIAIPSAVGFFVLAHPLFDLFFRTDNTVQAMMLRIGAISVVFYCLSTVTNAVLQGLNRMMAPVKNSAISLVIHLICLFIVLVFFKWGLYGVIVSKVIFSIIMCILNAHDIRETVGYVQEQRKTFVLPGIAAGIMGIVTFILHFVLNILINQHLATLISLFIAVLIYGLSLLLLNAISEDEILSMPKGATIIRLLKKLHLLNAGYY